MGTRYEDQPPEHWAGAASLDPTPVWKQYLAVAGFVLLALVLVTVVAYSALGVTLATPPASLPGGLIVLALADVPAVGAPARRYGPPLVDAGHSFFLVQTRRGEFLAIRAAGIGADVGVSVRVGASDEGSGPPPAFDRYLVSVEGPKVVVNTGRVIRGSEVVPAPSDPTFR